MRGRLSKLSRCRACSLKLTLTLTQTPTLTPSPNPNPSPNPKQGNLVKALDVYTAAIDAGVITLTLTLQVYL